MYNTFDEHTFTTAQRKITESDQEQKEYTKGKCRNGNFSSHLIERPLQEWKFFPPLSLSRKTL